MREGRELDCRAEIGCPWGGNRRKAWTREVRKVGKFPQKKREDMDRFDTPN